MASRPARSHRRRAEGDLEYTEVAVHPELGFHFLVGRPLARVLGSDAARLDGIPEASIESFAGTGNPFSLGPLASGANVVDVGSGAGIELAVVAAGFVGFEITCPRRSGGNEKAPAW